MFPMCPAMSSEEMCSCVLFQLAGFILLVRWPVGLSNGG
jgi:hypothetical protein